MILDFSDEQLCNTLNHVISGLLPHENYEPSNFGSLYPTLKTVLKTPDIRGIYFAFYTIFDKYFSLQSAVNVENFRVNITRSRFEKALSNNLPDLVLEPQLEVERLMNEEGRSGDISIPTIQNEAMGIIFSKSLALYDTCFSLAQTYEDAMGEIISLRDAIKANVIETGMQVQRAIMSTGLRYGRKFYRGTSGWIEYAQQLFREVSELDITSDGSLICDNLDMLSVVETQAKEMAEGLAEYGIPQLDDRTPLLRHRLAVLVARENTGKTKIITHLIASLIRQNRKVYFACGESDPDSIFLKVVSSYIYQEFGLYYVPEDMVSPVLETLSAEDLQVIQTAKARIALSGLVISNTLEYDNVLSTFIHFQLKGYDAFFVDHTQSLRGRRGRKITELVTSLALDCREFKNNYPVYVCLASQPSTNLKDILQKEQTTDIHQSPTAQSSTVSQEADEVFILTETDYLAKQNLLQWIVFKRRDASKPAPFYIRKLFHVSSYVYDPDIQSGENMDAEELEGLISSFNSEIDEEEGSSDLQVNW